MVLSGRVFVSGDAGFALAASWLRYTGAAERGTRSRNMMVLIEECLELYGIALFNWALCCELAKQSFQFDVKVRG